MEIKRLASCRVIILDAIDDPRLSAEDIHEKLDIENKLHLPSNLNPYLTEALRELTAGLRARMIADQEGFFELGFGLPFMNGGMGAHSVDVFITLFVAQENLLVLPKYPKQKHWMVTVPAPEHQPDYSKICDLLFEAILEHMNP